MIKTTYQKIVEYLMNHPGQYINRDRIRWDTFTTGKKFTRAMQDLECSGRIVFNGNGYKINQ